MIIKLTIGNAEYACDLNSGREISIPLRFNGPQPNAYGAAPARLTPLRVGSFVGDVREGGSCNCDQYAVTAHCNGTHTECIGHITAERISVADRMRDLLFPCTVISVQSDVSYNTKETYVPHFQNGDRVVTAMALEKGLRGASRDFLKGIVIRTLPNGIEKLDRDYTRDSFPFLSNEAMRFLRSRGVEHLLVDVPSVDRAEDEGKLSNHRIFWDVEASSVTDDARSARSITEMVFVPDNIADGPYLAAVQIPHFMTDAAPSRVILFTISERRIDD